MAYTTIEDFILENKTRFYHIAFMYVKNEQDALDIVSESILKALKHKGKIKNPDVFGKWFYKIVINTSIDLFRKNKAIDFADEYDLNNLVNMDQYENLDLKNAIAGLSQKYQTIIILRFFEDLKIDKIAAVLNENPNTIKTRLYKALDILKSKLHDEDMEIGGYYNEI